MELIKYIDNEVDKIKFVNFGIYQIMYNITVILNELDFYYDRNNYNFNNYLVQNIKVETIDNIKYFNLNDRKYYRKNNILYMEKNSKKYWIENEIFYVSEENIISVDLEKTFVSTNELLFNELNVITILSSIQKILNAITNVNFRQFLSIMKNKILFYGHCYAYNKLINLNFFYYLDNEKFYLKEFWEFYEAPTKGCIIKFGMNLIYLLNNFGSVKLSFITHKKILNNLNQITLNQN